MGSVVKSIFGGTDDSAQKAQTRANAKAAEFVKEQAALARGDILNLFPTADINRTLGFQAALDVIGETTPQQLGAFQQGNVGAQQALLSGLPQIQNAILGRPVDLSGLQPQRFDIDTSFAQRQLPQFTGAQEALNIPSQQSPLSGQVQPGQPIPQIRPNAQALPQNIAQLLAGSRGF